MVNNFDENRFHRRFIDAINNKEFEIYLQFIVDSENETVSGAEALSRWHCPESGVVNPGKYIEVVNKTRMIDELDLLVLEMVCSQLELWNGTEKENLFMSCNFTRATVSREDFAERFLEIIDKYDFDRENLVAELTEDTFSDDEESAYNNIIMCKEAGVKIAIDDLGSGYTSLSDLCSYPVDIIKIDRDIIKKSASVKGRILLSGISDIAHKMGIKVIHEGIENAEELKLAHEGDCDYIQGFYYSKMLPLEEAEAFLNNSVYYRK
ncbi:MAG: EAL domain-containing protein [Bacillota bacterium]|nr:EAL domain-containing protein [Bacillota bacterium]